MVGNYPNFRRIAKTAARAALEKKAVDVRLLDVRRDSDITDYLIVAGAESTAQMRAIDEEIQRALGPFRIRPLHREGHPGNRWTVLDYGGVVVHILLREARLFYRLENLWENAKAVPGWRRGPSRRHREAEDD